MTVKDFLARADSRKAIYTPRNPIHSFSGYVSGDPVQDFLGRWWIDFTTALGARFGLVPMENLLIIGTATATELENLQHALQGGQQ